MKLYYYPGACSMSVHIMLREAGQLFELEKVDLANKRNESGTDYLKVNAKGYVPALQLEDGSILTEAGVCVQYLADLAPQSDLAPAAGTMPRYRLMEWIAFVSTEIHKTLSPLFDPSLSEDGKKRQIGLVRKRLSFIADHLADRSYLMGEKFTAADAYLFNVLGWTKLFKIDIDEWPVLPKYLARIAQRPAVREAMKAEGLTQ